MKVTHETKKEIIRQHVEDKIPLSYLARKYNLAFGTLDYLYAFYLVWGDEAFKKKYNNYSIEEKTKAVERILSGESVRKVAIELKLSNISVLKKWKSTYLANSNKIVIMGKKGRKKLDFTKIESSENKSLKELQKENLRLRAEIDYLKKLQALRQKKSQQQGKK